MGSGCSSRFNDMLLATNFSLTIFVNVSWRIFAVNILVESLGVVSNFLMSDSSTWCKTRSFMQLHLLLAWQGKQHLHYSRKLFCHNTLFKLYDTLHDWWPPKLFKELGTVDVDDITNTWDNNHIFRFSAQLLNSWQCIAKQVLPG